jgi:murein DD-endopeptidase MepM/ murein hydrolase activator NlpD
MRRFFLFCFVLLIVAPPAALFYLSAKPSQRVNPEPRALGPDSVLKVQAAAKYGVRRVSAVLEQGQARAAAEWRDESRRWTFFRHPGRPRPAELRLRAEPARGFRSGRARLTVESEANDLRGRVARQSWDVTLALEPPQVEADHEPRILYQGGAGVALFRAAGFFTEAGVRIGAYSFRSYPLPGGPGPQVRFALFTFPWELPASTRAVVFARNEAGQEATAPLPLAVTPKAFRRRELALNDAFLRKVVTDLDPAGEGEMLERFLRINGPMREQNNETLAALKAKTAERFLWRPPFMQMTKTQVEALFADRRAYLYRGRKVDEQVHLGYDLSRVKQAPVQAANDGKVAFAGSLGIYGNCVVIDHGYGLQSVYAHLSSFQVKEGQEVKKAQEIARSGESGLAGGDHLHFSMLIDGVQTDPREWWDGAWIGKYIFDRVPAPK